MIFFISHLHMLSGRDRFPRALLTLEVPLAPLPPGHSPSVPLGVDRERLLECPHLSPDGISHTRGRPRNHEVTL